MNQFYAKRRNVKWLVSCALLVLFFTSIAPMPVAQAASLREDRHITYGAWLGNIPTSANVEAYEQLSGHHLDVAQFYIDWATDFSSILPTMQALAKEHSEAQITWESWQYNTLQISTGQADTYIRNFARAVHSYGKELQLRPLHEMNGNWYPWAIGDSTVNTNATFISAWKRIVTIFRQEHASNAKFVWGINAASVGAGATFTGAYPGNDYVSYVAVDGYNWGTTQSWGSTWQSFDTIFSASYQALTQLTHKPVLIPEWASAEIGGNKAAWITDAFQQVQSSKYSQIVGVDWFNMNKETDWRINSSPAALAAYRAGLKGNHN